MLLPDSWNFYCPAVDWTIEYVSPLIITFIPMSVGYPTTPVNTLSSKGLPESSYNSITISLNVDGEGNIFLNISSTGWSVF